MRQEFGFPVIRLELHGMKHTVLKALSEEMIKIDEQIQEAMEAALKTENIKRIVTEAVEKELKAAINSEIENFYRYGAGRKAIAAAVVERLRLDNANSRYEKES